MEDEAKAQSQRDEAEAQVSWLVTLDASGQTGGMLEAWAAGKSCLGGSGTCSTPSPPMCESPVLPAREKNSCWASALNLPHSGLVQFLFVATCNVK